MTKNSIRKDTIITVIFKEKCKEEKNDRIITILKSKVKDFKFTINDGKELPSMQFIPYEIKLDTKINLKNEWISVSDILYIIVESESKIEESNAEFISKIFDMLNSCIFSKIFAKKQKEDFSKILDEKLATKEENLTGD